MLINMTSFLAVRGHIPGWPGQNRGFLKVNDAFDYIVIGSGSAGSLMANRLSADPAMRVALIEAGPSDRQWPVNIKTIMPVGNIFLIPHALQLEAYAFRNAQIGGRSINFPRGKLMGGCSAITGALYPWPARGLRGLGQGR
jgi:choline dehydrogenase-like flavoprotein